MGVQLYNFAYNNNYKNIGVDDVNYDEEEL